MDVEPELLRQLPPGLALAWQVTPPGPPRRGPKPAHTVAEIVDEAQALADAEGFAALSMPRIAKRLGITATALYRYVSGKEELLVLLLERGWGPPPRELASAPSWRSAAEGWARAMWDRVRRHPWLLDLPISVPATPNLLGWLEAFLAGTASSGLSTVDRQACAILLDGHVRSTVRLTRDIAAGSARPEQAAATGRFLSAVLSERSPVLAEQIFGSPPPADATPGADEFDFGLERILDGIAVLVDRVPQPELSHPG